MYIRALDFLSPRITLYYKGEFRHKNIISGILTVISYLLIVVLSIIFLVELFDKSKPTAFFSNRFIEDGGLFPLDSSEKYKSIFHYYEVIDFGVMPDKNYNRFLRITAKDDPNMLSYWLYDFCELSDLGSFADEDAFTTFKQVYNEKLCLKYFWDDDAKKFIKKDDPSFRYPSVNHGMNNPAYTYYFSSVDLCKNDTEQDAILGRCASEEELIAFNTFHVVTFVIVDHDVDVDLYNKPIKINTYGISNANSRDSYTGNYINISPILVKTHQGLIFEKLKEEVSYRYDANEYIPTYEKDSGILCQFYIYLQNRQQLYDRSYKMLPEILGSIGGMSQVVSTLSGIINYLIHKFNLFLDVEIENRGYKDSEGKHKTNDISFSKVIKFEASSNNLRIQKGENKDGPPSKSEVIYSQVKFPSKKDNAESELSKFPLVSRNNRSEFLNLIDRCPISFKPKTGFTKPINYMYYQKTGFCGFLFYLITRPCKSKLKGREQYIETISTLHELIVSEETMYDTHFFLDYFLKISGDFPKNPINSELQMNNS